MIRSGSIAQAALARTSRPASRGGAARSSSRPGTGSRARSEPGSASTEPGSGLAWRTMHAVGVEHAARARRAAPPGVGPVGHRPMVGCRATARAEDRMGLLDGKTALIFGVANDHSIAWGIAQALHAEGAEVGFSSVESLIEKRVRPLAESIGSTFVEPCDVQSDEQIARVFARWGETARLARHPRPRARLRPARGPRRRLRRHLARRVRARARRLGLFARRADPRGAAAPPAAARRSSP